MTKREVPQEHSHRNVNLAVNTLLQQNNPAKIQDPVFALLGAKAAAEGAGDIADADCLQLAVADQAFTNAKEAGDVEGMTMALIYRALERNTGSVGLKSVPCESIKAVNPEIAALQQHQDPAADGAQALNKQIAEELARQIASIGGDPSMANEASTFAPGKIGDPTGAGNTCDDATDDAGCINTLGLRVDDLSEAEIAAAVADVKGAANGAAKGAAKGAAADNKNANKDNEAAAEQAITCGNDAAASAGHAAAAKDGAAAAAKDNAAAAKDGAAAATKDDAVSSKASADFGNCDPTIVFGLPSDGRKEDAFEPSDLTTFNHGSAQKIAIISNFICSQLANKCGASASAVSTCDAAASAANGLEGQAAATAFNTALGL
ncbi:hypothetical protein COCCADRAFT_100230 [Bipolaris zeicola 26-R-13]|uniref:Uncharacterized protein n=1 Tax=Cochliobolus carbonum (strain 26-R-13) TaxID=930089 RepID=W6Y2I7_COCC2|nr:uncharacterized protein COCCADRAFT_100230 [Bipolaris zeicola 26-R-13]EUC31835.1 hypothetical protein COCCADRAFT_100230 [Bipolaris zeicola 26-R-13]